MEIDTLMFAFLLHDRNIQKNKTNILFILFNVKGLATK